MAQVVPVFAASDETWIAFVSKFENVLRSASQQVKIERLLVQRNCEACRQFLSEYKSSEECNEADLPAPSNHITNAVSKKLHDAVISADALLGDAQALRQGRSVVKNKERKAGGPLVRCARTVERSKQTGTNWAKSSAAPKAIETEVAKCRSRTRSQSLVPLGRGTSKGAVRACSITRKECAGQREIKPARGRESLRNGYQEDCRKKYVALIVPPGTRERYSEYERATAKARTVAATQVPGRTRFLALLNEKNWTANEENTAKHSFEDIMVPTHVTYSSLCHLRDLAETVAKLRDVQLRSYINHTLSKSMMSMLRDMDRNDPNFVTVFRCLYSILISESRSFPVFVKNNG
ncbi:uncharacterized protein LOC135392182 [Ornithodoros turicata]|uniref:uncharacterized protein LOC135392182 n=1 Tax=Ornithodoros turicata TaxID=34597 RepID=UPI0031399B06